MIYEIESKMEISGATLIVRFPEKDLDCKALYTIQADQPAFLVPFRYRCVDGQVECTYTLGELNKLQYRFGTRAPDKYVEFWESVLQPLLDCDDWFMKPYSFVLKTPYLFTDREGKNVYYLYIPSLQNCVSFSELQEMVAELSRGNPATDTELENKALRAIMQNFQPKVFLQTLRELRPKMAQVKIHAPAHPVQKPEIHMPAADPVVLEGRPINTPAQAESMRSSENDIVIDLSGGEKAEKRAEKKSLCGHKNDKKKEEKQKKKGGLFGKKKEKASKDIVLGAAAEEVHQMPQQVQSAPVWTPPIDESEVTQLEGVYCGVCMRLVGDPSLPREISVNLIPGQAFTIGRFDVSLGRKMSDFEFDKRTKAVSRHHAVIERREDGGYTLMDLSSSAGTFLNGIRMTPNVPQQLERGSRIAFGTGGADYVWEE